MRYVSNAFVLLCFLALIWLIWAPRDALAERRRRSLLKSERFLDDEAFLAAIRAVESGANPRAVGKHGELGAYQFTAATWAQHTGAPHIWAQSPQFSDKIARAHLAYLQREVIERGRVPDVFTLALAWRYGPAFEAAQGHLCDYQRRVLALYNEEKRGR
jgi:hypothetical protein